MQHTSSVKAKPVRFWVIFTLQACMFQQSQHWGALELIPGKHRFLFSKYKVEAKTIIFDTKKSAKEPFKSQKTIWLLWSFSFLVQATCETLFRALYLVLGIWPDDIHILELVEWGKRIVLGFFWEKSLRKKLCLHPSMYAWDWGGDFTSLTRVNLQCSASCKGARAICSKRFVLLFLNTIQNNPVLSDFSRLRKATPAYVWSFYSSKTSYR